VLFRSTIANRLMHKYNLTDLEDIIYRIYQKPMTVEEIASISTLVTEAANRGDRIAREIFLHESEALAALVSTVAKRLHMASSKPDIYLTGGLFKAGQAILEPLKRELRKSIRHFTIRYPEFDPAVGGFILSLNEHNIDLDEAILTNLQRSYNRRVKISAGKSHSK
jgi:N-acetylglucosamine kinase-like BadF-type ATPase